MDGPLNKYFELQQIIQEDNQLRSNLEQLLTNDTAQVSLEKLIKRFPYDDYLIVCWSQLYEKLEPCTIEEVLHVSVYVDDLCLHGSLFLTLMLPDVSEPTESPVLVAFGCFLEMMRLFHWDEYLVPEAMQVFKHALLKMKCRQMAEWPATIPFLNSCLKVLAVRKMTMLELVGYIPMVIYFASNHFAKLNDQNAPEESIGVLAFDCLIAIIIKENIEKRDAVLAQLFTSAVQAMDNSDGLSALQYANKLSNFQTFFSNRTVFDVMKENPSAACYAIRCAFHKFNNSGSLVFVLNQAPLTVFTGFARVSGQFMKTNYNVNMQQFIFHVIETPHPTQDESELQQFAAVYCFLIKRFIVDPFYDTETNSQLTTTNIKLFYNLLLIPNLFIRKLLKQMCAVNFKPVLRKLADLCDEEWTPEYKTINQKFISIYCRVLIIDNLAKESQAFDKFKLLLKHAAANNLTTCNKDFKELDCKMPNDDLLMDICVSLTYIASQDGANTLFYLKLLSGIILNGAGLGEDIYSHIATVTNLGSKILRKMAQYRLILDEDFDAMSIACAGGRSWQIVSELPKYMDIQLNKHFMEFTMQLHHSRKLLLKRTELLYAIQFFSNVIDRHHLNAAPEDKVAYMKFGVFVESLVINRDAHKHLTPTALTTLRKYYEYFKIPLERVVAMFEEITALVTNAFRELIKYDGQFELVHIVSRDLFYYGETLIVFGDLPQFKCNQSILDVTEFALNYLQHAQFERGVSQFAADMIRCMVRIAIRNDSLLPVAVSALQNIIGKSDALMKQCCLECFHDIALYRTLNYEIMVPYIFDMLLSDDPDQICGATNSFAKIYLNDEVTLAQWQTFVLSRALGVHRPVIVTLRKRYVGLLFEKLEPLFGAHFMHTLFYLNAISDDPDHYLLEQYRPKIIRGRDDSIIRASTYDLMLSNMPPSWRNKILNYLYNTLKHKYFVLGTDHCLLEDVLIVTYISLKNRREDFPRHNESRFLSTMAQIAKFKTVGSRKLGTGINAEDILVTIIKKLVAILRQLSEEHKSIIANLLHVLFAIVHWHFNNIYNAAVDDGINSDLRRNVLDIGEYFTKWRKLMPFDEY